MARGLYTPGPSLECGRAALWCFDVHWPMPYRFGGYGRPALRHGAQGGFDFDIHIHCEDVCDPTRQQTQVSFT